jgi:outer membrane protein assembly factor BamB
MFLFDKSRNGRQNNTVFIHTPQVKWKTNLRTNPDYGAESTAVSDSKGNLYFGSHSGNFYSLAKEGNIRWTFSTTTKIYSSPILVDNRIIFAGGDGYLYCLDLSGNLVWMKDLSIPSDNMFKKKTLNKWLHLPFTYDFHKKRNIDYKCWSSPNWSNGKIYITAYGKGLYCLDIKGNVIWSQDLGFPRYQLSGVAIDQYGNVYCSSRAGKIYCFAESGKLLWEKLIKRNWENWGNPTLCDIKKQVYFFFSKKEKSGLVICTNLNGKILWEKKIESIRGSCCISSDGNEIFCCDLNGFIYRINSNDGSTILKKQITKAQRGLWITPSLDKNENILLSTKDSNTSGRVILMDKNFDFIWEFNCNKVLSIPIINESKELLFGCWDGFYYCLQ